MSRKDLPSHFYPDFFKMDLGIGGESENPLSLTLDNFIRNLDFEAQKKVFAIHPDNLGEDGQRRMLESLGFCCGQLSASQVARLLGGIHKLLSTGGTLGAIELLAEIYFGPAVVTRGRSFDKLRLVDRNEANSMVFVRLLQREPEELIEEFTRNAQSLVPFGFTVKVGQPLNDYRPREARISLGAPVRVEERVL